MNERPPRVSMRPAGGLAELRELCRRELSGTSTTAPRATVARAVLEVRLDGRVELVTLAVDGGRLLWTATDAEGAGPSPAARAAMQWLAEAGQGSSSGTIEAPLHAPAHETLAERLADLSLAVVRSGIAEDAPLAVRDALGRVVTELGAPTPSSARWLARLSTALAEADARQVARLLSIATSPQPRSEPPFGGPSRPVSDRRFLELAREHLDGWGGVPVEHRVLIDVEGGELVVEKRLAGGAASVGPCPRILDVGLGALSGVHPPELIAQQYTVSSEIAGGLWDRVEGHAVALAAAIVDARAALTAAPAAAEPISLVLGPTLEDGHLVDEAGSKLPLSREDTGAAEVLIELARTTPLRWVLVRWAARDTGLSAVPLAAGHRLGAGWAHVRLR